MTSEDYTLVEQRRNEFAGIFLLHYMITAPHNFAVEMQSGEEELRPLLDMLVSRGCLNAEAGYYVPSALGQEQLDRFMEKYVEYLIIYDVYSAVDLSMGEFAFEHYFDFEDDAAWYAYLDDARWEDLRVGVADYKDMDPLEIVFMSFVREGRFGGEGETSFLGIIDGACDDILEICNAALHEEDLGYDDVSGEAVLEDILSHGTELVFTLLEQEARFYDTTAQFVSPMTGAVIEGCSERFKAPDMEQLIHYRDPDYVSSHWRVSALI